MNANKFAWFFILISLLALIFIIYLFVDPWLFLTYNTILNQVNNVISYVTLIFSVLAFIIASLAYKVSIALPKLKLDVFPYLAEEEGPGLRIDEKENVDLTRPYNEWNIYLSNSGKVSAVNPIVKIEFNHLFFREEDLKGWIPVDHQQAFGWYSFQWVPSQKDSSMVHAGFSTKLPSIYFNGQHVRDLKNLELKITIAADKLKSKSYIMPIRIHR